MAYDPKGTLSVTGTTIERRAPENATQPSKVDETVAPEVESVTLSPKISALARKEAAQRQREQAFKQREQSFEARLAQAEKYEKLQAKIAAKDYSAAEELGLTYDEFTNYLLNKQQGEKPEEQRFRQVEEKLSNFEKAQAERVEQEYVANQSLWKQEIAKVISENEAFLNIRELGAQEAVLAHINDSFEEDGTELTVEAAAKDIEDELEKRAERFASLTKIKNKAQEQTKVLGPPKAGMTTLSNQMTTTPKTSQSKPFHLMSESEQLAEAIRRVNAAKLQR